MKNGMQTYFFLVSYGFGSKVFVLVIHKKIWDPGPEIQDPRSRICDPGSGIRKKFIPDLEPGSRG
jgi:hypothetical protein